MDHGKESRGNRRKQLRLGRTLGCLLFGLVISCGLDQGDRVAGGAPEPEVLVVEVPIEVPVEARGGAGGSAGDPAPLEPEEPTDCFLQNSTGLWWEIKSETPGHLREASATYSWFMPESVEKFYEGIADKGECSALSCDTQAYVNAVNATFLCGYSDWRLPTTEELLGRADLGMPGDDFPPEEPFYWTSDYSIDDADVVQGVYLCCGGIEAPAVKYGAGRILLVRDDTDDSADDSGDVAE